MHEWLLLYRANSWLSVAGSLSRLRQGSSWPALTMDPSLRSGIEGLLQKAREGMQHVQRMHQIPELLGNHTKMYRCRLEPTFVHVHKDNRDGVGIVASEAIALLSDIADSGWNWSECRPMCVEAHGDAQIEKFNQELTKSGEIPPVEPGTCKYASVSCSHTNMVLRMFRAGFRHPDARFTCNGNLPMDMLKGFDKEFCDAASTGLLWDVLSQDVVKEFPELPNLFQQAMNTGSQIQRKESELQMARRSQMIVVSAGSHGTSAFDDMKEKIVGT